jgi:putative transposase
VPRGPEDEERLTADMVALARQYGRYGYRKIAEFLRRAGWQVNDKRVERLWRREGLKVPAKQPKRGRLWLTDGLCIRLRAEYRNHVWSYDFVEDRTHDGRKFRMLNIVDEFTHECLAIRVSRKLKSIDVIDVLSDLFILRGVPGHIRSDNGPEFVAKAVQDWIAAVGAKTAYIAPGSPWENGYIESWRRHYNGVRPHASLGYRAPAPEVFVPAFAAWPAAQPRPAPPGRATAGAETVPKLTLPPDHSAGADQGSLHKPGPDTLHFGGNTSCVEVRTSADTLVIIDCGSGLHGLGQALLGAGKRVLKGHILISHTHWDHIQGIPFFAPFFVPGNEWDIYAPKGLGQSL